MEIAWEQCPRVPKENGGLRVQLRIQWEIQCFGVDLKYVNLSFQGKHGE